MQNRVLKLAGFLVIALAIVVSVDIAPYAAEILLTRGNGDTNVRIVNVYYSCGGGGSFALVRIGSPEDAEAHDVVEAMGLTVYVPKSMSFENGVPKIVTFPRSTGARDVGVSNTTN